MLTIKPVLKIIFPPCCDESIISCRSHMQTDFQGRKKDFFLINLTENQKIKSLLNI